MKPMRKNNVSDEDKKGNKWRARVVQFLLFALVGVSNAMISWIVYAICIRVRIHYLPATAIGFSVSMVNAYFWNNKIVFKGEKVVWWRAFIRTYLAYSVTGLFLNGLLLHLWLDILQVGPFFEPVCRWLHKFNLKVENGRRFVEYFAPFFNYCITVPINYGLNKFWAFGPPKKET